MKVSLKPNFQYTKLSLHKFIKNKQRFPKLQYRSDEFVSTVKKNKVVGSSNYIKLRDALKKYSEYGIKTAEDLKALSKYCTEQGVVCIPALLALINLFNYIKYSENETVEDCYNHGELNFKNYSDCLKNNRKFDSAKISIAEKMNEPFKFIELISTIESLNIHKNNKNIFKIISDCIDNGADSYFLIQALDIMSEKEINTKNLPGVLMLYNELKKRGTHTSDLIEIASGCFSNKEAALEFYTPEILKTLTLIKNCVFIPKDIETAKKIKTEVMKALEKYGAGTFTVYTDKDGLHSILHTFQDVCTQMMFVNLKTYSSDGSEVSSTKSILNPISASDKYSGNTFLDETYYKDLLKNIEIERISIRYSPLVSNVIEQKIVRKNPKGEIIRTEYYKQSPVNGSYDIFYSYPDGRIEVVSRGLEDPITGDIIRKEHLVSGDGTISDINYCETASGNSEYTYKITLPNGGRVMDRTIKLEKIDDSRIISTVDGKKYEIEITESKVVVTDTSQTPIKKYYLNIGQRGKSYITKDLIPLIKKLPGDEIINYIKRKLKLINNDETSGYISNTIHINNSNIDSSFVMLHEGGHSADVKQIGKSYIYKYSSSREFKKAIDEELKVLKETQPEILLTTDMNYLFTLLSSKRSRGEFFAEANAIISTPTDIRNYAIRSFELRRNFPKAIAKFAQFRNIFTDKT